MESLCLDMKFNILSGLSIENLMQLRACNREFRDLIDDPLFRKLYRNQSTPNPVTFLTLIQYNSEEDCAFHFSRYDNVDRQYYISHRISYPPLTRVGRSQIIVGSCNGLVCYCENHMMEFPPIYIFNPVTRERLCLTPPPRPFSEHEGIVVNGFGYHPVTKEYKVVRITFNGQSGKALVGGVDVYTLGTGEWRSVQNVPSQFGVFSELPGVNVNGSLYWHDAHYLIASFDLETEYFQYVPSPAGFEEPLINMNPDYTYGLCAWMDSLCVVRYDHIHEISEVWVKNNDGWEVELRAPFSDIEHLQLDDCTFITCTDNRQVIQWYNDEVVASYDLENRERIVYGQRSHYFNDLTLHVKSFVSIKDLGEPSSTIMEGDVCFLTLVRLYEGNPGCFYLRKCGDVTSQ